MKKVLLSVSILALVAVVFYQLKPVKYTANALASEVSSINLLNKDSLTIKTRVNPPKGYKRVPYAEGSLQSYLRNYELKSFGTKIINYDDTEYFWQLGHVGILDIPVPKNGLQQCADALIRIRSEYLWDHGRKNEIGFNFTSGDYCSWKNMRTDIDQGLMGIT